MTMPIMPEARTYDHATSAFRQKIAELENRLAESEETLRAIRSGKVDAITATTPAGHLVFSLNGAEQSYREMIEAMSEGAANVMPDGLVLYCNQRFADMAKTDLRAVMGTNLQTYLVPEDRTGIASALGKCGTTRVRAQMLGVDGETVPVNVAMHRQADKGSLGFVIITAISDLTDIVAAQDAIAKTNRDLEQRVTELHASEHRYQSLLETMNDGLIETDETPALTYVNPQFAEMLGHTVDEMLGRPANQFITSAALEGVQERVAERKAGRSEVYELSWLHREGHEVPTRISSRPHFGPDGSYTGSTANVTDITESKRIEFAQLKADADLRAASTHARSLIEASLDPLVTINADGKITDVNQATEAATGLPRAQLVGADFSDCFTEPEKARAVYRSVFAEGAVTDYPLAIRNVSGHVMEVLYNASTYCDAKDQVIGVFAAARDITARKEAEYKLVIYQRHLEDLVAERTADLADANQALNTANRELETFAYSVSHDLRAPLRAVDGFSHMLQEDYGDKLDPEAQRLIQVIRDGTGKMGQLIDDILAFSRVTRRELAASAIDMTGLVRATLSDLALAMIGRNTKVNVGPLPQMRGDKEMMQRVWMNLLDNAVKFTGRKQNAQIDVGSYPEAEGTVYFVKDNGAGFDMSYVDKLFGVFQRLHGPEEFPGTGAGLAIVKRIVGRHGGRVWAEGNVGEGATIYFALPPQAPAHA